jgi:hypothetical protein
MTLFGGIAIVPRLLTLLVDGLSMTEGTDCSSFRFLCDIVELIG